MEMRHVFFALLFLLAIIPLIRPLMLPVYISPQVKSFYDKVNELNPESKVLIGLTEEFSFFIGLRTFWYATLKHIFSQGLNVIFVSFSPGGEAASEYVVKYGDLAGELNLEYGKDYVIMSYLAGEEMAMAAIASDFPKAFSTDYKGTPIDEIPLLKDVKNMNDIDLAIGEYSIFTFGEMFVRQWSVKFKPMLIIGQFYGIAPYWGTYVVGNIDRTLRAYAEWEFLVGIPGEELTRLDAQNMQAAVVIAAVFAGIIMWFGARKTAERWGIAKRY